MDQSDVMPQPGTPLPEARDDKKPVEVVRETSVS
jgi:hypothetical protein